MENQKNEFMHKYYCEICDYKAKSDYIWLKHTSSNKHIIGGLKNKTCEICNHECVNHWNLKQHHILNHATVEERERQKYYCKDCNKVFLSKLYYDKHIACKKHINRLKCIDEINKINEKLMKN